MFLCPVTVVRWRTEGVTVGIALLTTFSVLLCVLCLIQRSRRMYMTAPIQANLIDRADVDLEDPFEHQPDLYALTGMYTPAWNIANAPTDPLENATPTSLAEVLGRALAERASRIVAVSEPPTSSFVEPLEVAELEDPASRLYLGNHVPCCYVCFDTSPSVALWCGHVLCNYCYRRWYLQTQVSGTIKCWFCGELARGSLRLFYGGLEVDENHASLPEVSEPSASEVQTLAPH